MCVLCCCHKLHIGELKGKHFKNSQCHQNDYNGTTEYCNLCDGWTFFILVLFIEILGEMLHVQQSRCWVHHASTALDSHNSLWHRFNKLPKTFIRDFGPIDMIDMVMAHYPGGSSHQKTGTLWPLRDERGQ